MKRYWYLVVDVYGTPERIENALDEAGKQGYRMRETRFYHYNTAEYESPFGVRAIFEREESIDDDD